MDVSALIPFVVLIITVLGGFWAVYSKLDAKIDTAIENLRTALVAAISNEMGSSRAEIAQIRTRIDMFFDRNVIK